VYRKQIKMTHNDIWQRILTFNIFHESCEEKTKHIIINLCSSSTLDIFLDNYQSIVNSEPHVLKNYFLVICGINTNLEIIKYLIENQKMNINHTNNNGNNCLTLACRENTNLEIIRYLIEDQKMDINHTSNYGNNCLTIACWRNTNLEIIKYLIENQKMNIYNTKNNDGDNCLTFACRGNTNLKIIRYLIEEQKMNINHINDYGNNCLIFACRGNTNLEIIRYLIEDQKMDINHTSNYGNNCLTLACEKDTNLETIRYLIENTDVKITINKMPKYPIWEKIILGITKNWDRYSEIFNNGIKKYDIAKIVKVINPLLLMLHSYLYSNHNICHPFDAMCKYEDFARYVEDLKFPVSVPMPISKTEVAVEKTKKIKYDYRENNMGLIFIYNNEKYYGHRERVYDSIMCLKEIKEITDFDEPIILSGSIPMYVMNLWIESMYTKVFDITEIHPNDIIYFLKHIDQYPTDILSIDKIEQNLIEYFDTMQYNVAYDMYLRDICHRYKLKRLYLCLHNKKMEIL
jgi:hypothetical protein